MFCKDQITGTLVNYYVTCKREAWLYAHHIHADQDDENVLMGKALADIKERDLQDFAFSNLKFDKLSKQHGDYLITKYPRFSVTSESEVKKEPKKRACGQDAADFLYLSFENGLKFKRGKRQTNQREKGDFGGG